MITFSCPACQKKLSVKDELAGKKGNCPGCGQVVAVPAPAAAPATVDVRPPSPKMASEPAGRDERTHALTHTPSSNPDATQGFANPDAAHDSNLTSFLAPPQADDELGRLGKYRVLKILGHGGMGVVFLAEDPKLRRKVAIKAMLPTLGASASAGQRFLREAQAMAAVEHDHIVRVYQVDEERGVPFLAMEFLKGEPLDERLEREEKVPPDEVLRIGREIAEALGAAHATGLIHRDIKPANIWLEAPRGRVKILDFGLARAASQEDAGLTQQGTIIGTPAYMAPEQGRGEAVDARSDLFSLGCVLYRMATGQQPFQAKDTVSTLLAVASHQPPPPARLGGGVPQELSDLVMRLMEKDADRRPASAASVVEGLWAVEAKLARPREGGEAGSPVGRGGDAIEGKPARQREAREDTIQVTSEPRELPVPPKARRIRTPLMIALALLALLPLGWRLATVILRVETDKGTLVVEMNDAEVEARIKNGKLILTDADGKDRYTLGPGDRNEKIDAGPYKVRVEGADGLVLDTTEFTLKKAGKVTVRVTMDTKAVAKSGEPDRKAAEYVLSIGGTVKVTDQNQDIKAVADLPKDAFRLTVVALQLNKQVNDAGLAHFAACKNLTSLDLSYTKVSDAGLAHFKDCKNLTSLDLNYTKVSDAGLAHFKDCKNLGVLSLAGTGVGDTGLAHFKDCNNLRGLKLHGTQVGDAGLAHFEACKNLMSLDLSYTKVSDAGLAHFKDCKNLDILSLLGTEVDDMGLANFKGCKNLKQLGLSSTKVSDAGVAHFKDCKNLTQVYLQKTKVTAKGIEGLKKALPECRIAWDGDLEPKASLDPDRKAAEYVLSIGGVIRVNDQERDIKVVADLPKEAFRLTRTNLLYENKLVSDAGLAHFKGCKNLRWLWLKGTQVSDAGLANVKDCKDLENLGLSGTQVRDAGLAYFKDCKNLTVLDLGRTKVGDAGLANFKECKNLTELELGGTQVSDAGLAHFENCKNLTTLDLNSTKVGNAGMAHFKRCKNLTHLVLNSTQVSDAGLAHFEGCKYLTYLDLKTTNVGDDGLAHFKDCKNLTTLILFNTQVGDAGLGHFAGCKNLTLLVLRKTKVTAAKIKELKKALPSCKIVWEGVIEPENK